MKIFKQLCAALLGLLSVCVFVLCIVAPIGAWRVQPALTEGTARTFTKANDALEIASRSLRLADEGLRQAKEDLDTIKTTNLPDETHPAKPDFRNELMSSFLVDRLGNKVHNVSETVSAVTDASIVLNSLMDGLNRLPEPSLVGLNTDQLKQFQHSLTDVAKSAQELNGLLELGAPEAMGNYPVVMQVSLIDQVMARLIRRVGEFREKVTALQTELGAVKTRTLEWIRIGPMVITIVSLWLAACQVSMFVLARAWFKRLGKSVPPVSHPSQ